MLNRTQPDDIQTTYEPPEDSKLGIALIRAYEKLAELEAVQLAAAQINGRLRGADGFLMAVRNHQIPITSENFMANVAKAVQDVEVAAAARSTSETQVGEAQSNYAAASQRVNHMAVALRGAKSPGKVAHVRQKYLNEEPPAGVFDRVCERVRAVG